ncbi:MAG: cytochrome c oxidase subunit 4 [Pseudolysinimonas sp.]|uniref:cytochrome c oxidase subunit 4 n=1 Tax=Pseudolysinimonas sp. TaxID=2680009 RepID=UPI0032659A1F
MRVNANLFWILGAFFLISAAGYTVWSLIDYGNTPTAVQPITHQGVEWVGTVGITLGAVLSFFLGFYITITRRAQGGDLPEDSLTAAIDDGDPEVGQFSPWSWWPMFLAFGLALFFLGLAIGTWISFIGAPLAVIAIIGWQYEYYRGFFAR